MATCDYHYESDDKCNETAVVTPEGRKPLCKPHYDLIMTYSRPTAMPRQKDDTILEEAAGLIYGDRQQQYGNAAENFSDIALLWAPIIGKDIGPEAAALCLLQLKVARAIRDVREDRPIKRDTIVDLAGYAGCIEKIQKGV